MPPGPVRSPLGIALTSELGFSYHRSILLPSPTTRTSATAPEASQPPSGTHAVAHGSVHGTEWICSATKQPTCISGYVVSGAVARASPCHWTQARRARSISSRHSTHLLSCCHLLPTTQEQASVAPPACTPATTPQPAPWMQSGQRSPDWHQRSDRIVGSHWDTRQPGEANCWLANR